MGIGERYQEETKYFPEDFGYPSLEGISPEPDGEIIPLEKPRDVEVNLRELLLRRRSIREFTGGYVDFGIFSTFLWISLGATRRGLGYTLRTFPSAGALYPVEGYLVVEKVEGLEPGVYHYLPDEHSVRLLERGSYMKSLAVASLGQSWISRASFSVVLTGVVERITWKYRDRGYRYMYMEAGHIGQNIYLAAGALGLGTCAIGAFFDDEVARIVGADGKREVSLYLFPVGTV